MALFDSLSARLYAGIGALAVAMATIGAATLGLAAHTEGALRASESHSVASQALSSAQSALWELRYGFPQFMVVDEAGRRKITDAEPKLRERIESEFRRYEKTAPTAEELKLLAEVQQVFKKYMDARPRWFELMSAGKTDEAKEWRAATTTPLGAATVKGFSDVIAMQAAVAAKEVEAGLAEARAKRNTIAVLLLAVLGGTAGAGVWVVRSITRGAASARDAARRIADGDLATPVPSGGRDEMGLLLDAMRAMQQNLTRVVGAVRGNADCVATASAQIAQGNMNLSQRTEEQSSALQRTSSTMEQFGSTIHRNADSARQASELANGASDVAERGGRVVGQVVETMKGISESSSKISEIIATIDGIAFQTNILALNAAVEAARAGEQGRGFAVVASEVRTLAQRSAEAAREIKSLITASVARIDQGTALVDQAGSTMSDVVLSVKRVSEMVAHISAASAEQRAGVEDVGGAVSQMDQATQQNAALVEESAAAAESLQQQAKELVQAVSVFRLPARA